MNERFEWTTEQDEELINLRDIQGKSWHDIGLHFDLADEDVRNRHRRLRKTGFEHVSEMVQGWWRNLVPSNDGEMDKPRVDIPRIGLFDIETLPAEVYAWQFYDNTVGIEQVISTSCLLSWTGKFLNDSEVYSDILTPSEAKSKQDLRITKSCWDFLSKCDIVTGHNVIDFDSKVISTCFLRHDLPPLKYIQVDTLKIARANFRFESNKLQFINRTLGLREKIEHEGFPLWRKCREGDKDALGRMLEYNQNDVMALEELFYKVRPYIRNINVALYNTIEVPICPVCGWEKLEQVGFYYTPASKFDSMRCEKCGALSRKKQNHVTTAKKKSLLINS